MLLLVDVFLERRTARPAPKIFRDLSTGVAYLFVALIALHAVGVEPGSILTTSAVLTAVVGLSLQDTLGNLWMPLSLREPPAYYAPERGTVTIDPSVTRAPLT